MAGKALKASGKRIMKYYRDGAVERDLLQQSETRISGRTEEAVLKTEAPADELFGKDHKPQEQAEQPKHQKLRFIDEQQDTGSKLQADYATHREETPLTFENTAPVPTTSVENTETTIPEKPMPLDDRSESAEQSEPEPSYSSELYEDWRSDAGSDDAPIADKTTNFDFRADVVADKNGKSHKSRKYKFGKEPEDVESADIKPENDDKRFPKHSDDDFSFTGEKPEHEDEPLPDAERKHRKIQHVYFLNLVDEYDLLAFKEQFPGNAPVEVNADKKTDTKADKTADPEESGSGDEPDTKDTAKPDNSGGNNSMILIIGAVALIGGGAFYYFKIYKKKPKQPKTPQYDEDEDDAEEETVNEDSPDVQETNDSDE